MKTSVLRITALSLVAIVMLAAPAALRAAESTYAPAGGQEAASKHKRPEHTTVPFHGKLTAVNTNAMTITVGDRTFEITSETKITKDNVPANLADGVLGEMVGGAFRKGADGKLTATMIHFAVAPGRKNSEGSKPKSKKPGAEDSGSHTNSGTN